MGWKGCFPVGELHFTQKSRLLHEGRFFIDARGYFG